MTLPAGQNLMEIVVHLVDGSSMRFGQSDAHALGKIFHNFQPSRLFANPMLTIGDHHSLTAFPSHRVVRVDLIARGTPDYDLPLGIGQVQEITDSEYDDAITQQRAGVTQPRFGEIQLNDGSVVYIKLVPDAQEAVELAMERTPLTAMDQPHAFLNRIFNGHGLVAQRLGGGLTILNPAQFARLKVYPDPLNMPPGGMPAGIWEASPLD
jgi:hypothetical protein